MTAVLFDLDGTLIDSLPNVRDAANEVLMQHDLPALASDVVAGFVGLGEQVFVDRLIAATSLEPGARAVILEQFLAAYGRVAQETRCFPGVIDTLSVLHAWRVPMGIVTNKPRAPLVPTLQSAGLAPYFTAVAAGDDLAVRKPDPAPLQHVLKRLGETTCIYIGDTLIDAETAQSAGVPFGLFTEGIRTVPVEDIPHVFKFDHFDKLPGVLSEQFRGFWP